MVGDEYSDPAVLEIEDYLLQVVYGDWVNTRERLVEQDASRFGRRKTHNHIKRCGLSSTVWSQEADYFSLADVEADPVYNPATLVTLADFFGRQCLHLLDNSSFGDTLSRISALN